MDLKYFTVYKEITSAISRVGTLPWCYEFAVYYLNVQLEGSILIADNQTLGMHLDGRYSPHVVDTLFNTFGQSD